MFRHALEIERGLLEMTITYALTDADGGTGVLGVHDELPRGVSTANSEAGWRTSLAKLAALVETAYSSCDTPPDRDE